MFSLVHVYILHHHLDLLNIDHNFFLSLQNFMIESSLDYRWAQDPRQLKKYENDKCWQVMLHRLQNY